MPKKSKKSKSKRTTLKQKYKVIKKVKEHHKKKAKLDKKLGRKAKKQKDPGIPGQWPFKQDLLKELEWEKQRAAAEQKRKKEERRLAEANAGQHDDEMADGLTIEDVQNEAAAKQRAFESNQAEPSTSGRGNGTDNSRRAFYKEFVKVVEAADVIIEVLDARDPLSTRCTDVERYVRKSGATKKLILLLNKIDLVPREAAEAWLKHLREELPTVAFKCSTQKQRENTGQRRGGTRGAPQSASADHGMSGSTCLGADMLLQLLKKYSLASGMKQAITVGVVGLPNVGKSSLINSLKRKHAAATGNTPGVTTTVQEVHLDKKVTLLDSPGIVFSPAGNAHAALLNCTKVEQIEDPTEPAAEVVRRCDQKQLMALYKVGTFEDADDLLRKIAVARGKLRPGGVPIIEAAARILLHDWNDGRIPFFTMPPQRDTHGHAAAAVVPSWSSDFNVDQAFTDQQSAMLADLPSVEDGNFTETPAGQAADGALEGMDVDEGLRRMSDDDEDREGSEDEAGSDMSDGEPGPAQRLTRQAVKAAAAQAQQQAVKLYQEEGQFNPHAARAQRKQAKKGQRRQVSLATKKAADEEYDFAEAFDNVAVGSDED